MKFVSAILLVIGLSWAAAADDIAVEINGKKVEFAHQPTTVGGRLLVPLREIFEALEAEVIYHEPTETFRATQGETTVQILLNRHTAIINGRPVFLKVPARRREDTVYIPLRFISDTMGAQMQWDQETKTAHLSPAVIAWRTEPIDEPELVTGPRIERVIHSGTAPLGPGEALEVVIFGEPGCKATFFIGDTIAPVDVPEVSAGRYQTSYTLPALLQMEEAKVVATLRKNEQSSSAEAAALLTVKDASSTAPTKWTVTPAKDSTVTIKRPQFTATFPEPIQTRGFRFLLDGLDFTSRAQVTDQSFLWQPTYDLSAGQHKASIQATSDTGEALRYEWVFTVQ